METLADVLYYLIRHVPAAMTDLADMEKIVKAQFGDPPEARAAAKAQQEQEAGQQAPAAAAAAPSPAAAAEAPPPPAAATGATGMGGFTGNMTVKQVLDELPADVLEQLAAQARQREAAAAPAPGSPAAG
jgi:hypothetical protein